jgi:phage-related protein
MAQSGGKHPSAKPLKGFKGAGVLEIIEDHDGDTYRAVYTVRFAGVIYVLHVFQKKSKKRIETPKHVIDLIKSRLKTAERDYREQEAAE